jgi:hypothetical protein
MPTAYPRRNATPFRLVPESATRWCRALGLLALVGCSSGGEGGSTAPAPSGTIAVTLTPASVTVPPGGSGSVGVSITRGGSFEGAVALVASGVPAGVTVTFGSATVSAGTGSTSLNVTVATGTAVGTSEVTITGAGTGTSVVSPGSRLTLRVQ